MIVAVALWASDASADDPACRRIDDATITAQVHGAGIWIGGVAFSFDDIAAAAVEADRYTSAPAIVLTFTPTGQRKFAISQRCGVRRPIDVWIDNDLIARPYLNMVITGPTVSIMGNWSWAEAEALARRFRPTTR